MEVCTAVEIAQIVLKQAAERAGIKKAITLDTLQHNFATHLLESGTNFRYIQDLSRHNSPKTTMIYTQVSSTSLKILSILLICKKHF